MKKRHILIVPAVAAAAVLGGSLALADQPTQGSTQSAPPDAGDRGDRQEPTYTGTIAVPQNETTGQTEAQESAALAGLAKITADEAKAAALGRFPNATVRSTSLDDENGWLVWSVDLLDGTTARDVKVDAGNGTILAVDSGGDNEQGEAAETANGSEGPEGAETGD